jgi:hypothetical protein
MVHGHQCQHLSLEENQGRVGSECLYSREHEGHPEGLTSSSAGLSQALYRSLFSWHAPSLQGFLIELEGGTDPRKRLPVRRSSLTVAAREVIPP